MVRIEPEHKLVHAIGVGDLQAHTYRYETLVLATDYFGQQGELKVNRVDWPIKLT